MAATRDAATNKRSLKHFTSATLTASLEFAPDYNDAPQSMQPVIIWDDQFGMRTLHMMFWRCLPPERYGDFHQLTFVRSNHGSVEYPVITLD